MMKLLTFFLIIFINYSIHAKGYDVFGVGFYDVKFDGSDTNQATDFRYEPYNLSIGSLNDCTALELTCPVGVTCDENYYYRAYSYMDERFQIYISFDADIVNNFSEESIRKNFRYIDFVFRFPEYSNETLSYHYSPLDPIKKLEFKRIAFSAGNYISSL